MTFDLPKNASLAIRDPFGLSKSHPYAYYSAGDSWILYSAGPDKDYDIDPVNDGDDVFDPASLLLIMKTYDPTNGTVSDGDVWLTGKANASVVP